MTGLLLLGAVWAHTLAPARLTLEETPAGWQMVQRIPRSALGTLEITPPCDAGPPQVDLQPQHATISHALRCTAAPEAVAVSGIEDSGSAVLVEVRRGGQIGRQVHTADGVAPLPPPQGPLQHAGRYLRAGVVHVLLGLDHVLVILALALSAGAGWLRVVTGFTAGHSLTLVACALGWLSVPAVLAESLIALSLIGLGDQILRQRTARPQVWRMAALIGLLHGLGFGSGLAELGLPLEATGLALAAFNLGVEAGQVIIVAAALRFSALGRSRPVLAGALAAVGTYFLLETLT